MKAIFLKEIQYAKKYWIQGEEWEKPGEVNKANNTGPSVAC